MGASMTTHPKIDIFPSTVTNMPSNDKSLANHQAATDVTIRAKNIHENTFDINVLTLLEATV
jgi:hypothetical protein